MSHSYEFIKEVVPSVLADMLRLNPVILELFEHIEYLEEETKIIIYMNKVLVSSEEDELNQIINEYSTSHKQYIMHSIKEGWQDERMKKGRSITSHIAALNQIAGKDMSTLFDIYKPENDLKLLNLIDSGAFEMAYIRGYEMWKAGEITVNPRWSQEELYEVMTRLQWEIGQSMAETLKAGVDAGAIATGW